MVRCVTSVTRVQGCAVRPRHPRTIHPMSAITMGSGGSGVEDPAGDRPQRPEGGRSDRGTLVRTDIQGLRAIAVSLVVIYHLCAAAPSPAASSAWTSSS